MALLDTVLKTAENYGTTIFPNGVESVQMAGPVIPIGAGRQSWLVRLTGGGRTIVVSLVTDADSRVEISHHLRAAA